MDLVIMRVMRNSMEGRHDGRLRCHPDGRPVVLHDAHYSTGPKTLMPRPGTTAVLVALSAVALQVEALPSFLKLIPGSNNVPGVYAIGHVQAGGGGARNSFGKDFDKADRVWSQALCYKDSDGDGQFNGAELGDPCCEWVQDTNEKLLYTTATAPGDKNSKQDPSIWANVTCADGTDPVTKYTTRGFAASNSTGSATAVSAEYEDEDESDEKATSKVPAPAPTQASTASAVVGSTVVAAGATIAVLLA